VPRTAVGGEARAVGGQRDASPRIEQSDDLGGGPGHPLFEAFAGRNAAGLESHLDLGFVLAVGLADQQLPVAKGESPLRNSRRPAAFGPPPAGPATLSPPPRAAPKFGGMRTGSTAGKTRDSASASSDNDFENNPKGNLVYTWNRVNFTTPRCLGT